MRRADFCFVNLSFKPGGGNRVIIELANCLIDSNYTCRLISLIPSKGGKFSKLECSSKIKISSFLKSNSSLVIFVNLLLTLIHLMVARKRYKVIIINNPFLAPIFGLLRLKNMYYYIQADDYRIFDDQYLVKNKILLGLYKYATKVITYNIYKENYLFNSRFSFERFTEISRQAIVDPIFILPGVDLSIFFSLSSKHSDEKSIRPIKVATVLRKHPLKGSRDFLAIIENISRILNDESPGCEFVAITNEDCSHLTIPGNVQILRPRNDVELAQILKQVDIFVVTSWWEGFGLPGLEAMACGCTLITTRNGGCNEYALDKVNCMTYESQNSEELEGLVLQLAKDKDLRETISKNGIKTAQSFSWKSSASMLEKLLTLPGSGR